MNDEIPHYQVVCAIIYHSEDRDQVLVAQRGSDDRYLADKYEFPGGKIESGESPQQAIVREIEEELSMVVVPESHLEPVDWDYKTFSITLIPIICRSEDQKFNANEHAKVHWHSVADLMHLDWAPADVPIVVALIKRSQPKI